MKKLHLGCGPRFLKGYIHIDLSNYDHIDHRVDIANMKSLFEDNSIDEIYACHVLEHFSRKDIIPVLKEWNRILKPGGKMRLSVPDFEAIVSFYLKEGQLHQLQGFLCGGQKDHLDHHHVVFDFTLMKKTLESLGFINVKKYDYKSFLPTSYDDYSKCYLPHMDEKGILMSLNIICEKKDHIKIWNSDVEWAFGTWRPWLSMVKN